MASESRATAGDVDSLSARLHGSLIRPGDPPYDEARALYNAMVDKRPALIACCADVEDVVALHPFSAGGAYVNMMMEEGHERVEASFGENYERLAGIKAKYDPDNLFHVNQNIPPAG